MLVFFCETSVIGGGPRVRAWWSYERGVQGGDVSIVDDWTPSRSAPTTRMRHLKAANDNGIAWPFVPFPYGWYAAVERIGRNLSGLKGLAPEQPKRRFEIAFEAESLPPVHHHFVSRGDRLWPYVDRLAQPDRER
jgi:hypothetical protein